MSAMDLVLMNRQLTDNPLYVYNGNGDRFDISSQPIIENPNILEIMDSDLLERKGKPYERYMFNGVRVPRVTSILEYCTAENKDYLMKWSAKLGQNYLNQKKQILDTGTKIHEAIAEYLTSGTLYCIKNLGSSLKQEVMQSVKNFIAWYNHVTIDLKWSVEIFILEVPLICPWFGGTADAIMIINGKRYIVDFKSSKRIHSEYFIQVSTYKWIIDNYYPEYGPIDGVGILRFDKNNDVYEDIFLEVSDPRDLQYITHCQQTFSLAVNLFYSVGVLNKETTVIKANKKDVSNIGKISEGIKKDPVKHKKKK